MPQHVYTKCIVGYIGCSGVDKFNFASGSSVVGHVYTYSNRTTIVAQSNPRMDQPMTISGM